MVCDRCSARILKQEKTGACIVSETDDGSEMLTLVVKGDEADQIFVMTPQQLLPFLGQGWDAILEGVAPFKQS